ncbi:DUF4398 domain-containing protein [Aquabacterium sp.]|uniref:DUF4398 domain-containing protein n=1 Tax=Aquabacterium sp. TaxID=1872578 RepID=UPI002E326054|nr:DUF4398 domain-containing protein [Aquabacterium sp.]HEX5311972.1 DUF4398 domain-containing protein [Aquabacterium sp.]
MPRRFNLIGVGGGAHGTWPFVLGGAVLVLAACASSVPPPTALMAVSSAAVADAAMAGASEFAPAEMRLARDKIDRAQAAMTNHEYERARVLAQEAQADAQLAIAKARSAKAAKASAAVRDDSRALQEELQRKSK